MDEDHIAHIGLYLLSLVLLWFPLRPRKPKAVYARFNQMLRDAYISWFVVGSFALIYGIFGHLLTKLPLGEHILAFAPFAAPIGLILYLPYRWYWSQPFARKRTGIAAVDEAVQRYEKDGRAVEVWFPSLVVDGKRYRCANYGGGEWLFIEENGQVLREERLAHILRNMVRVVFSIAHQEVLVQRGQNYQAAQKAVKGLQMMLRRFNQIMQPVLEIGGSKYETSIQKVKRALEVGLLFQQKMCEYWVLEGEWGQRRAGADGRKLKELTYEDWRDLTDQYRSKMLWLRDEIGTLQEGKIAAEQLQRLVKMHPEIAERSSWLKYVLAAVITQANDLEEAFPYLQRGMIPTYERGMEPNEIEGWRARLAWVDLVDSWVAQGYTGEALKAKKEEYLKAQERAERERRREERQRKREERARQRAEREAKRSLKQQDMKEQ